MWELASVRWFAAGLQGVGDAAPSDVRRRASPWEAPDAGHQMGPATGKWRGGDPSLPGGQAAWARETAQSADAAETPTRGPY